MLVPKLATTLRGYTRQQLAADVVAGVIVGIIALPLSIAFGIASGVTPERGLVTAVVAGFLISALGGSRVQIGGPTGAFVVIVYGIVQQHGLDGLMAATMLAGVILVVLGLARLGGAIKFIPYPVTTGFTSGIAVIIFSSQVKDLLGLRMGTVPAEFVEKWRAYAEHAGTAAPAAAAVAAATVAVILLWPKVNRRIPGPFVALVAVTAAVQFLDVPVETIGDRFGEIRAALPAPALPSVSFSTLTKLAAPAFTIALLAAIESLLSAVVADGMIGGRHRSNMELVAQGVANIASPLFGGLPATGAIARTATNVRNGGRTPVAGIVHAVTVLLIALFFGRWAALIPMAALAGILAIVAYHMSEWRAFLSELKGPRSDAAVLLVTFLLTVVVDLTVAIGVGMVLASFLFMARMAEVTDVRAITREFADEEEGEDLQATSRYQVPDGVQVYEINGPFFFGAAEKAQEALLQVGRTPAVLILRMRNVPAIDATGIRALVTVVQRCRHAGTRVVLSGVNAQPRQALGRSEVLAEIGEENLAGSFEEALALAREHLQSLATMRSVAGA